MKQNEEGSDVVKNAGVLVSVSPANVQVLRDTSTKPEAAQDETPEPEHSVTKHSVTVAGKTLNYTARAGRMALRTEHGRAKARVFFTAYTRDETGALEQRPVTFVFNGGPGSSSVWLHLGAFGPWRVLLDEKNLIAPPGKLIENAYSLLDESDLVFIDPVATGYSRAVEGEEEKQFHGYNEDIEAVGEFIRMYTTEFKRWASPKYLAGESYGTIRAAGLAGFLQRRHGMYLNGIILISAVLQFQTLSFDGGNDLPYALFLPVYAATALYHGRIQSPDLCDLEPMELYKKAEEFALGPYSRALMLGNALVTQERREILAELSRFTGLDENIIDTEHLRISWDVFVEHLLAKERRMVGRLDARFKGYEKYASRGDFLLDPGYTAILGPYSASMNHYLRTDLDCKYDVAYEILSGERVSPWNFGDAQNRYLDVGATLRDAMGINPNLKIFVACGIYDLATPPLAMEYSLRHMGLDPELEKNIVTEYYPAGHMVYIHDPSLKKMKSDLVKFIKNSREI